MHTETNICKKMTSYAYSWHNENGSFSVHSFNQHYLSIAQFTGSWGNRFQEIHGTSTVKG